MDLGKDCRGWKLLQDSSSIPSCLGRVTGVGSANAYGSASPSCLSEMLSDLALTLRPELASDDDARWHASIVRGAADPGDLRPSAGMKDQYVADVNDFYKYALLRELANAHDGRLIVAWMRTPPDATRDGRHLEYLERPELFRPMDPELFDALQQLVRADMRAVAAVEERDVVPAAAFCSELIRDDATERAEWFARLRSVRCPGDLVFFDPDNGLAVPSVRSGRRGSCKYLYWSELAEALQADRSACIYQHYARRRRAVYLEELGERMRDLRPGTEVAAVMTPRVAFMLAGTRKQIDVFCDAASGLIARCPGTMQWWRLQGVSATV